MKQQGESLEITERKDTGKWKCSTALRNIVERESMRKKIR